MPDSSYTLDDLLYLMQRLRDPATGCPWDIEQTFTSIVPHTLEEAYEVADAIERGDFAGLPAELGDLLFQVVYYCQMAVEQERFEFADVVDTCVRKLLRRHPHVFPHGQLRQSAAPTRLNQQQLDQQWQHIKQQERGAPQQLSLLDDVPLALPAMSRAVKLQKKAARVGFDWPDLAGIFAKLQEETLELQEAIALDNRKHMEHELGDLLFAVTNLARRLQIDPEQALRGCNQRFYQRFNHIEQQLHQQGLAVEHADLEQLNLLWEQAKQHLQQQE